MTADLLPVAVSIPAHGMRSASLLVHVDPSEHARRQEAGLGAVTSPDVLDLLLELPEGFPVARGALSWRQQELLAGRRFPPGAVERSRTHITRLAVRPCRVVLTRVEGAPTRRDLGRASSFAPFCARTLVIPRLPRRADFLAEADFWGIGITYRAPDGTEETLVEPRPWRPMRHTPAGWRFVEQAYAEYLKQPTA